MNYLICTFLFFLAKSIDHNSFESVSKIEIFFVLFFIFFCIFYFVLQIMFRFLVFLESKNFAYFQFISNSLLKL